MTTVQAGAVLAMAVAWLYSCAKTRRYHRKGSTPYVLFCISPLLVGVGLLLPLHAGVILLASLLYPPLTLHALVRLLFKKRVQVHLAVSETTDDDIAVRWVTTVYKPNQTLVGSKATYYWVDQIILGVTFYAGFVLLVLAAARA
jgi:hypothetical protein